MNRIADAIRKQKFKEIVINDSDVADFDESMKKIADAFDLILSKKSNFEM